jgi:hypothetical protein
MRSSVTSRPQGNQQPPGCRHSWHCQLPPLPSGAVHAADMVKSTNPVLQGCSTFQRNAHPRPGTLAPTSPPPCKRLRLPLRRANPSAVLASHKNFDDSRTTCKAQSSRATHPHRAWKRRAVMTNEQRTTLIRMPQWAPPFRSLRVSSLDALTRSRSQRKPLRETTRMKSYQTKQTSVPFLNSRALLLFQSPQFRPGAGSTDARPR